MPTFLVERYWPGVNPESAHASTLRILEAIDAMGEYGANVRCLASVLVDDDDAVLTLYRAPAIEAVIEVNRRADLPLDRISTCTDLIAPNNGFTRAGEALRVPPQ